MSSAVVASFKTISSSLKTCRKISCSSVRIGCTEVGLRKECRLWGPTLVHAQFPKSAPGIVTAKLGKSEPGIMIANQAVLGRRDVLAPERAESLSASEFAEMVQDVLLHTALQDAAAHQPGVDHERVALEFCEHHADQAVVSEPVAQGNGASQPGIVLHHGLHLRRRVTASREVELVGSVDELDAAIESRRLNRPDAHGHLQRPEEAIEVVGRGFGGLSVRVGPIVVGPLEVLRAQGQRLEITMALQRHDVAGGVQWKLRL